MDIRTQTVLLAAILGLALGLSMLLRPGRPRVLTLFSLFALSIGSYYLAHFFQSLLPAQPFERIAILLGALIPSAALGFFLEFLGVSPSTLRYGRQGAVLSAVLG